MAFVPKNKSYIDPKTQLPSIELFREHARGLFYDCGLPKNHRGGASLLINKHSELFPSGLKNRLFELYEKGARAGLFFQQEYKTTDGSRNREETYIIKSAEDFRSPIIKVTARIQPLADCENLIPNYEVITPNGPFQVSSIGDLILFLTEVTDDLIKRNAETTAKNKASSSSSTQTTETPPKNTGEIGDNITPL